MSIAIPKHILQDTNLNGNEKIMLSLVSNGSGEPLRAGDDYIAQFIGLKTGRKVQGVIKTLSGKGYIDVAHDNFGRYISIAGKADNCNKPTVPMPDIIPSSETRGHKKWTVSDLWDSIVATWDKNPQYKTISDAFFQWWTTSIDGKMRFHDSKTWNTAGRLRTWYSRQSNNSYQAPPPTSHQSPRAGAVDKTKLGSEFL